MRTVSAPKDFLTNCYSREGIYPFLKKMEEEFLTNKRPFAVLIMDVDHFKTFNDKFGHLYGDEVLKYFSSSLRLDLEDEENVPFRFGGDEFVMVFPNKTTVEAYRLATRFKKNMRTRSCLIKGRQISVTFSGGIAGYPADANTVDDILENADKALYYSKNHGRGRITKCGELAQKELLQIGGILAVLAVVGGLLFLNRDHLAGKVDEVTPWFSRWTQPNLAATDGSPTEIKAESQAAENSQTEPLPIEPEKTDAGQNVSAPEILPKTSQIHLESGRIVKGIIKNEDDEAVEVEVSLNEGKGILQIKKSQIIRIARE